MVHVESAVFKYLSVYVGGTQYNTYRHIHSKKIKLFTLLLLLLYIVSGVRFNTLILYVVYQSITAFSAKSYTHASHYIYMFCYTVCALGTPPIGIAH